MTETTDRLLNDQLRADAGQVRAYHHDATYHAQWHVLRQALDRAHRALIATGDTEADKVVAALAEGHPDAFAAARRMDESRALADQIARSGMFPRAAGERQEQ